MTPQFVFQVAINACKTIQVSNHIENIQFFTEYGEPGYTTRKGIIALGNWNKVDTYNPQTKKREIVSDLPKRLGNILEKMGVELEWSDEWCACQDCNKLLRTEPDNHWWKPSYVANEQEGTFLCKECAKEDSEDSEEV